MPSPTYRLLLLLLGAVLTANLAYGWHYQAKVLDRTGEDQAFAAMSQFNNVLQLVRTHYYDDKKVAYKTLIQGALKGMLETLDPFSSYMPPTEFSNMSEQMKGQLGGIGVVITVNKEGKLCVVAPVAGSPSANAGILPNDQIVAVDKVLANTMKLDAVIHMIKGDPGTKVLITVYRPATDKQLDFELTRSVIEIATVQNVTVLPGNIGYLQLTEFSAKTPDELFRALRDLNVGSLNGLIIDERNNPGGLLDSAAAVCELFLSTGDLIVYTEGREGIRQQEIFARDVLPSGNVAPHYLKPPLVILINGGSASGAEVVAGCLQDHHRAQLVGEKSFGKGSVQEVYNLPDGGGVRLTIAHYFTPSARIIHEHGIPPDVEVKLAPEAAAKLHALRSQQMGKITTAGDPQLQKAVDLLLEHPVTADPDAPIATPAPALH